MHSCCPGASTVRIIAAASGLPARHARLQEDDQDIQEEGVDSLTEDELRQACRWGGPGRIGKCIPFPG